MSTYVVQALENNKIPWLKSVLDQAFSVEPEDFFYQFSGTPAIILLPKKLHRFLYKNYLIAMEIKERLIEYCTMCIKCRGA